MVKYKYWTETNTNYTVTENILTTPVMQDFHSTLRLNNDTVTRSFWYPRVDVRTDRTSGAPTPYWWVGSTIYLNVVWDRDSSFPAVPVNVGAGDIRTMGAVSLTPEPFIYDSSFDTTVTFRLPGGPLALRAHRKGLGGEVIPQVIGEVWGFDNYGVLNQSHGAHVITRLSMISRVLWESDQAPA